MNYKKFPFFYRTRDQYLKILDHFLSAQDSIVPPQARSTRFVFNTNFISVGSTPYSIVEIRKKIPKTQPGKKKYIGTVSILRNSLGLIDVEKDLKQLGAELVSRTPNKPKYNKDDITRESVRIKNAQHFRRMTSVLNKEYGHGNWHLRGARKILAKLKEAERMKDHLVFLDSNSHKLINEIIDKGLKVDVVVPTKGDNLQKVLFKIQLMS